VNRLENQTRRRFMLLLVAALWHVPLWFVLRPDMPERMTHRLPAHSGMALSFLPLSQEPGTGPMEADARILWSPVLFSLPSPVGFSKPLFPQRLMPPPEKLRNQEAGALLMKPLSTGRRFTITASDPLGYQAQRLLSRREVLRLPGVLHHEAIRPAAGLHVAFRDALAGRTVSGVPVDPATLPAGDQAWLAVIHVRFAPEGWPAFALLDRGTGDEALDQALVREVRRWRLEDSAEPREGRVEVRYQP